MRQQRDATLETAMDAVSCNGLPARPLEPEQYTRLTALTRLLLDVLSSDAPTRGADVAIDSHALFDRSLAANPLPRKPDCKKGCGHCCRTYVSATAPEIFAIARAMRELPAAHFAAMRERVREAAEATTPGWSQDRFFTYQCPLLEEGACSLHPVRPDACRGVSSYSVDACIRSIAAASQKRDEPIPKVREHAILRSLHAHGLWAALQAAGLPYTYYSLNQGLDRVLDTPEAEPRWLAGEDIFAGVPNDTMLEGQARAMVEATIRTLIAGATGKMPAPADMPEIASPLGLLRIRPEAPGDEAFRLALFVDTRPDLALLPDAARDSIMQMQFRAQTQGHRAQHPNARHEIIEHAGRPVGRLLCERADGVLHLVDIALAPPLRNRGAGTAILSKLLADAKRERLRVRLMVASNNPHAARLYARLGFVQTAGDAMHAVMEWRDESLQPLSPAP